MSRKHCCIKSQKADLGGSLEPKIISTIPFSEKKKKDEFSEIQQMIFKNHMPHNGVTDKLLL